MKKHHFFNSYLTTTISVSLVLFLVGLEVILLLSARRIVKEVKESITLTIVLSEDADSVEVARLGNLLDIAPFSSSSRYISSAEALQEHIESLGEDPTKFLGYNPLTSSFEVHLTEDYTQKDKIENIEQQLSEFTCIDRFVCQEDIVDMLDQNVGKISYILLAIAVLLLFVVVALIVNTIRLQIYSKRFLINTMKLVGAKAWTIEKPIVGKNVLLGLIAALVALIALAGAAYLCYSQLGIMIIDCTMVNLAIVSVAVIAVGILITFLTSVATVKRYIRMQTNDLYFI